MVNTKKEPHFCLFTVVAFENDQLTSFYSYACTSMDDCKKNRTFCNFGSRKIQTKLG